LRALAQGSTVRVVDLVRAWLNAQGVAATVEQQTGAQLPRHKTSMPVDIVTRASDGLPVR